MHFVGRIAGTPKANSDCNKRNAKSLGLDAVGGPATATTVSTLSPRGDLVSYAQLSGMPIHLLQGAHIGKGLHFQSFWMTMELGIADR